MRRHRARPRITTLAVVAVLLGLVAVAPVHAKEGFEARLDAPLSIDSEPGSTLTVGWTVFTMADGEQVPMYGSPVFIRILPRGNGEPVTAFGTERPAGSGHYVADIVVPSTGIGIVEIGLRGEQCEAGVCHTSDIGFRLTGDTLASGTGPGVVVGVREPGAVAPGATAVAPVATSVPVVTSTDPAAAPSTAAPAPLQTGLIAVGFGLIVAFGLLLAMRRRRQHGDPPATAPTRS